MTLRIEHKDNIGYTTKYQHPDGSETSIKTNLSCQFKAEGNNLVLDSKDNNKYSLVISCSAGCQMECSFCHLTQKGVQHKRLSPESVLNNLIETVVTEYKYLKGQGINLSTKYIKLCWMGMGEPMSEIPLVKEVTKNFLEYVFNNNLACGLDGVDISTVMPSRLSIAKYSDLQEISRSLSDYKHNPSQVGKSPMRLFYSLHVANDKRDVMVPNTYDYRKALTDLNYFCNATRADLIVHCMFIEGQNDSQQDIDELINLVKPTGRELRVLRYNPSDNTTKESGNIKDIVSYLNSQYDKVKVQYSSGQDILAACGQFL